MEWVETTGETVPAAKELALDQLGVDEQDAEFEVLEAEAVGWFGRLKSPARVRARVRPRAPRPKVDQRDRRRSGRKRGGRNRRGGAESSTAPNKESSGKAPTRQEQSPGTAREQRPRGRGRNKEKPAPQAAPAKSDKQHEQAGEKNVDDMSMEEQAEVAVDFLRGLAEAFGVDAAVSWKEGDEEVLLVDVSGDGLGLLVGAEGRTLYAIQELARTALQRAAGGGRSARLRIDIGGYREKRRVALDRFVRQVADRVRSEGLEQALEPMGSADRKIVHDVINELDGVRTISEGEEPRRRVVIVPA